MRMFYNYLLVGAVATVPSVFVASADRCEISCRLALRQRAPTTGKKNTRTVWLHTTPAITARQKPN